MSFAYCKNQKPSAQALLAGSCLERTWHINQLDPIKLVSKSAVSAYNSFEVSMSRKSALGSIQMHTRNKFNRITTSKTNARQITSIENIEMKQSGSTFDINWTEQGVIFDQYGAAGPLKASGNVKKRNGAGTGAGASLRLRACRLRPPAGGPGGMGLFSAGGGFSLLIVSVSNTRSRLPHGPV